MRADQSHGVGNRVGPHVVQEHGVDAELERFGQLLQGVHFDLHRHAHSGAAHGAKRRRDAARRGDVIVLDHHRVVEADAVIPPARTAYFSKARSPGVVLRVSEIETPVPATSST